MSNKTPRSEAQKAADKVYALKRKETNTSIQLPKGLRNQLKARAESENCNMIELIEKLLSFNAQL